jgi:F-type H+-transporting ATPase subunit c
MKMLQLLALVVFTLSIVVTPLLAQGKTPDKSEREKFQEGKYPPPNVPVFAGSGVAAGLGMGLTIIGAGYGLGKIGSAALESMARQPEVAPRIQTAMIIIAAMLEGATLASVLLCYLIGGASTF